MSVLDKKQLVEISFEHTAMVDNGSREAAINRAVDECCALASVLEAGARGVASTPYGSVVLPYVDNEKLYEHAQQIKNNSALKALALVGIGGSSLGVLAVVQAILGQYHNELDDSLKFYAMDTVDTDRAYDHYRILEKVMSQGKRFLLVVVSKSGSTLETLTNLALFLELLKKYEPHHWARYVVVISGEGKTPLSNWAYEHDIACYPIPSAVGGRFSVFSPAGLFPLACLGVDVQGLLRGARAFLKDVPESGSENSAAQMAALKYCHYKQGRNICDMFLFDPQAEALGKWYRQLMAESLGKEFDNAGERVNVGPTPTVSVGTNDLHSVAQLYLGGPRDKFTTFVTMGSLHGITVPHNTEDSSLFTMVEGKGFNQIMEAVIGGTQRAFANAQRPFCTVALTQRSVESLGYFMQMCMLEIIYLGNMLSINPFDQPQVELYKSETRALLTGVK